MTNKEMTDIEIELDGVILGNTTAIVLAIGVILGAYLGANGYTFLFAFATIAFAIFQVYMAAKKVKRKLNE